MATRAKIFQRRHRSPYRRIVAPINPKSVIKNINSYDTPAPVVALIQPMMVAITAMPPR